MDATLHVMRRSLNVEVDLSGADADRVDMVRSFLRRPEVQGENPEYDLLVKDMALVGLAALECAQKLGLL